MHHDYIATIGLEVHCQVNTVSKMFCGCRTSFGEEPNTNVCPTCLGLPGSLPVLNKTAIEQTGPFPPFPFKVPEMYKRDTLDIRWTFSYL